MKIIKHQRYFIKLTLIILHFNFQIKYNKSKVNISIVVKTGSCKGHIGILSQESQISILEYDEELVY